MDEASALPLEIDVGDSILASVLSKYGTLIILASATARTAARLKESIRMTPYHNSRM